MHKPPPSPRAGMGDHLRHWRQLRRLSQLDLAADAELSTRHLSCVETGKASPSRELVLRLCERLAVPLRERDAWLVAAGYAPMYREHAMDDPSMVAAQRAVQHLLDSHEPDAIHGKLSPAAFERLDADLHALRDRPVSRAVVAGTLWPIGPFAAG